jgi:hypothetical protein
MPKSANFDAYRMAEVLILVAKDFSRCVWRIDSGGRGDLTGLSTWQFPSTKGKVGDLGDLGENPCPILTHSHPVLTSITPVSKVLTHLTYTRPKIKSDAILELNAY